VVAAGVGGDENGEEVGADSASYRIFGAQTDACYGWGGVLSCDVASGEQIVKSLAFNIIDANKGLLKR
jgi:hypothetical protein